MRRRCGDAKDRTFHRYGGRGIYVCSEWDKSLTEFVRWSLRHGYEGGLTLDRIDNDGPYHPDNCRWATDEEQSRNKRTNRWVTAWGESKIVADWVADSRCAVNRTCLHSRLGKGWPPEEAISYPPRGRPRRGGEK
jgi:hypothetical protein